MVPVCVCCLAKAHGLRYRVGKLAFELFPPVVTNKGEGIRRLIEAHNLKVVICLGDDVSGTDAFRVLRAVRASGNCMTLSVGVLHPDSLARLINSADVVVDGPACARALIESLIERSPGSTLTTKRSHSLSLDVCSWAQFRLVSPARDADWIARSG
jgi:trehalose-phosphatase